jgi:hypothetical protein
VYDASQTGSHIVLISAAGWPTTRMAPCRSQYCALLPEHIRTSYNEQLTQAETNLRLYKCHISSVIRMLSGQQSCATATSRHAARITLHPSHKCSLQASSPMLLIMPRAVTITAKPPASTLAPHTHCPAGTTQQRCAACTAELPCFHQEAGVLDLHCVRG